MPYGSSYKSGSGLGAEQTTTPERPSTGSGSPMRGVSSTTLPDSAIDEKRNVDNAPVKFPEDLADDFYISFNAFKHSMDRPGEAMKFTFRKSIVLPIPSNLTDSASAGYNSENLYYLGNAGKELASSLVNEKGIGGAVSYAFSEKGLNDATQSIAQGIRNISNKNAASNIVLGGVVNALSGAPGVIPNAAKSALQLTANPFPVMIFQGTSFKPAFTFDWTLYPESLAEANSIKKIVGFFRREMLPERMENNSSILKAPSVFEIKLRPKNIARTFKKCVLTNMGVNYAPNGPSFITDVTGTQEKFPSSVALSLTFQEIEVWLANDYYTQEEFFFDPKSEYQI